MERAIDQLPPALPDARQFALLNRFQHGFPIQQRPFAALAAQLDMDEAAVIEALRTLRAAGLVSRVGPVFRPNVVGASALAALAVPAGRLEAVARAVSARPEVNHNYEREHDFNLWFVVTACDAASLRAVLDQIEQAGACGAALVLPMIADYHIDLGFDLTASASSLYSESAAAPRHDRPGRDRPGRLKLGHAERALIAATQDGLPLVERPFAALGCDEQWAIATLAHWIGAGVIRRFGVIVRHQELGFTDNAMVVWDVPDEQVDQVGRRIAASGQVTLCYRRQRQLPDWRYNLFFMMHGKDRAEVEARIVRLAAECGLNDYVRATLFSRRRFKQRGARYAILPENAHGPA